MTIDQDVRSRLEALNQRWPTLPPHEFQRLSPSHPSAHITNRRGPRAPSMNFVCGTQHPHLIKSVPAQDGTRLCDRCAQWLRARSGAGL